jgi:hypothetical protein
MATANEARRRIPLACRPIVARFPDMPTTKAQEDSKQKSEDEVGEGNHDADRRYREATEKYVKSGAVEPAAKEARRAMDDPGQREDLKKAEDEARHHTARTKP